jgi:LysM repeat protein
MANLTNVPVTGSNGQTTYYSGDDSGLAAYQTQMGASPNSPSLTTSGTAAPSLGGTGGTISPSAATATQAQPNQAPPTSDLATGAQGANVEQLQDYLVQMGYLTPNQLTGGQGTYGPQTTAAVAQLQQQLGVTPNGEYNNQTQQALSQKYSNVFSSVQNQPAPNQAGQANAVISQLTQPSTDPVLNAMTSSLAPIMQSLNQVLSNINNPQLTAVSLQNEYNQLSAQYDLPDMNAQLLNLQNIMNGTTDDIRQEITAAGGSASESQIQAMSSARNTVIQKQYNALATQYQAAQTNVTNLMQYASQDQSNQLQVQQATAGIVENMASIESNMQSMGMTMQQNALSNYQKTLTTLGGDYSAFASTVPSSMQPYVESIMGLAPGTLSDPQELQILTNASYKQIQLQIAAQRAAVYGYNAGYPVSVSVPSGTPTTAGSGGTATNLTPATNVSPFAQNNPVNAAQSSSSYTVASGDTLKGIAAQNGITTDAGVKAIASLNGIANENAIQPGESIQIPIQVKDNASGQTGYILPSSFDASKYTQLGGTPISAPQSTIATQYTAMAAKVKAAEANPISGSPLNKGRMTRNANSALSNYLASPVYAAVSSGASYLARINAAVQDPGSISDTSLADAIIKIETGGGQVTDSQISTYFAGQSFADKFAVEGDKITGQGGVLSPSQRTQLVNLAQSVFSNYQTQYQQLYVQAMTNLQGQGIPLNYGGNMPDFLSLIQNAPATSQ